MTVSINFVTDGKFAVRFEIINLTDGRSFHEAICLMIFPKLCIFSLFLISIISPLISDDGDLVCRLLISEMQHALEMRLPSCKWRYKYLLNDDVVVAVVVVVVVVVVAVKQKSNMKVEFSDKISPFNPYF